MTTDLPSGTVTFLFTDIEGSTTLWERYPEAMKAALARHDQLLREAIESHNGHVVKTTGDGCHAAFDFAADALEAVVRAQRALAASQQYAVTSDGFSIQVRMGLHTGETELRDGDYYGSAVNRSARIMSIGYGGQVLLSGVTASLLDGRLPSGVILRDMGDHRLKDLSRPERVFQLVIDDLRADFPPLKSLDALPGNLPVQLTTFIGRERELAEVRQLLRAARLLTLTGPGGTGKTRLSLQVAADVQSEYANGAWLVELAPLTDTGLVPAAVAGLFDLSSQPGLTLAAALTDYLRGKQLLLVLDNCEHLVEACARLAAELLPACPRLTILASSREGLGVPGETTYHVPTLALPGEHETTAAAVCRYDAADLFLQRARSVQPNFHVTDANAAAIAQIVRRLDGIPLAIELAAARVRMLSPEQIAARLDDRFRLLTGGSRTALPRQQALRALIDWSYTLLSPEEAALFRRLGVFVGGWTFEAAEEVASGRSQVAGVEIDIKQDDVLDLLAGLVNKSLVVVDDATGETRYHLLETIRQYARDKLFESGEGEAIRDRHYAWYANRLESLHLVSIYGVERWSGELSAEEDVVIWGLLDHESDNFRAALDWGLGRAGESASLETAVLSAARFAWILAIAGQQDEGARWTRAALDRLGTESPAGAASAHWKQLLVVALLGDSTMHMGLGDQARGLQTAEAGLALAREIEGEDSLFRVLNHVVFQMSLMRTDGVVPLAEELLELSRRQQRDFGQLTALFALAGAALSRGDRDRGRALMGEAFSLFDLQSMARARPYFYFQRAMLLLLQGETERGIADLRIAEEQLRGQRTPQLQARLVSELAHALRRAGRVDEALPAYRVSIRKWLDLGRRPAIANQLESFAFIARASGQSEHAARLFGAAEAIREAVHVDMASWERDEYERELAVLREALPAETFAVEWAAGRALDLDAAVNLAVDTDTGTSVPRAGSLRQKDIEG